MAVSARLNHLKVSLRSISWFSDRNMAVSAWLNHLKVLLRPILWFSGVNNAVSVGPNQQMWEMNFAKKKDL